MNVQKYKKKTTHTICKTKNQDFSDKLSVVPPIGIDSIRSTIRVGFVPFVTGAPAEEVIPADIALIINPFVGSVLYFPLLGFPTTANFCRYFKRATGIYPQAYKKSITAC